MGRSNLVQSNFLAGEIGPHGIGRLDTRDYFQGAQLMENFIVMPEGGARKRPGFTLSNNTAVGSLGKQKAYSHVMSIRVSGVRQSWILFVLPEESAGISNRLKLYSLSSGGYPTATAETINLASGSLLTSTSDFTGYTRSIQINDLMIICDETGQKPPLALRRLFVGGSFYISYLFEEFTQNALGGFGFLTAALNYRNVPYLPNNVNDAFRVKGSATSGSITLTAEDDSANPIALFSPNMVGSFMRIVHGATTGFVLITGYTSSVAVSAFVLRNLANTNATPTWAEAAWSNKNGWPRTVALAGERLCFGATDKQPNVVWFSRLGNIFFFLQNRDGSVGFTGAPEATDPFNIGVGRNAYAEVTWMEFDRFLLVGTNSGEFSIGSREGYSAIDLPAVVPQTEIGGTLSTVGRESVFFISSQGKKVTNLIYSDERAGFIPQDTSVLNKDIVDNAGNNEGVSDLYRNGTYIKVRYDSDNKVVWCQNDKNALIGITAREGNQPEYAFHRHLIADGEILTFDLLSIEGLGDSIIALGWNKTSDSCFILFMAWDFRHKQLNASQALERPIYLDWAVPFSDTPNAMAGPIYNQDGDLLDVYVNGDYKGEFAVDNGNIVDDDVVPLPFPALSGHIGKKFSATIKTMPLEPQSLFGAGFPTIKRIERVIFRLYRSQFMNFGPHLTNLDDVEIPINNNEAFSGVTEQHHLDISYSEAQEFYLVSALPGPLCILNVGFRCSVSD